MPWTNFPPRSFINNFIPVFFENQLYVCTYACIREYLKVVQAQVTYVVPQLAHEREEAESGGLLVIKDCFIVDYTRIWV